MLTTWLLDLASARQLGLRRPPATPRAARRRRPRPSPTNLWLEPGPVTAGELIGDIDTGFYVTELMGMGVNGVTGDYSRGAAGFWIEHGELAYPGERGHRRRQSQGHVPAPDRRRAISNSSTGIDAPTLRIDGMTVAGA